MYTSNIKDSAPFFDEVSSSERSPSSFPRDEQKSMLEWNEPSTTDSIEDFGTARHSLTDDGFHQGLEFFGGNDPLFSDKPNPFHNACPSSSTSPRKQSGTNPSRYEFDTSFTSVFGDSTIEGSGFHCSHDEKIVGDNCEAACDNNDTAVPDDFFNVFGTSGRMESGLAGHHEEEAPRLSRHSQSQTSSSTSSASRKLKPSFRDVRKSDSSSILEDSITADSKTVFSTDFFSPPRPFPSNRVERTLVGSTMTNLFDLDEEGSQSDENYERTGRNDHFHCSRSLFGATIHNNNSRKEAVDGTPMVTPKACALEEKNQIKEFGTTTTAAWKTSNEVLDEKRDRRVQDDRMRSEPSTRSRRSLGSLRSQRSTDRPMERECEVNQSKKKNTSNGRRRSDLIDANGEKSERHRDGVPSTRSRSKSCNRKTSSCSKRSKSRDRKTTSTSRSRSKSRDSVTCDADKGRSKSRGRNQASKSQSGSTSQDQERIGKDRGRSKSHEREKSSNTRNRSQSQDRKVPSRSRSQSLDRKESSTSKSRDCKATSRDRSEACIHRDSKNRDRSKSRERGSAPNRTRSISRSRSCRNPNAVVTTLGADNRAMESGYQRKPDGQPGEHALLSPARPRIRRRESNSLRHRADRLGGNTPTNDPFKENSFSLFAMSPEYRKQDNSGLSPFPSDEFNAFRSPTSVIPLSSPFLMEANDGLEKSENFDLAPFLPPSSNGKEDTFSSPLMHNRTTLDSSSTPLSSLKHQSLSASKRQAFLSRTRTSGTGREKMSAQLKSPATYRSSRIIDDKWASEPPASIREILTSSQAHRTPNGSLRSRRMFDDAGIGGSLGRPSSPRRRISENHSYPPGLVSKRRNQEAKDRKGRIANAMSNILES